MGRWPSVFLALSCVVGASAVTRPARADIQICLDAFEEAQREVKHGKLLAARSRFYLCADPTCPAPVRADCLRMRDDVERAIPTIAFVVRDASGADVDAQITLDRLDLVIPAGRATPIDPGKHVVTYTRRGYEPVDQVFTVVEGEKSRSVVLVARNDAVVKSDPPKSVAVDHAPEKPAGSTNGPWPWIVFGTGAAFVATGVYFFVQFISFQNRKDEVVAQFDAASKAGVKGQPNPEADYYQDQFNELKSKQQVSLAFSTIGATLGLGSIVAGVILVVKGSGSSAGAASITIVPHVASTGSGAFVVGSF